MKDFIVLVADKNMQFALQGGLDRPESLGTRPISFDFRQHPDRDGGARSNGATLAELAKRTVHFNTVKEPGKALIRDLTI